MPPLAASAPLSGGSGACSVFLDFFFEEDLGRVLGVSAASLEGDVSKDG